MIEVKLDEKAAMDRYKLVTKMHEIQIQYLNGKITYDEFEKKNCIRNRREYSP